MSGDIHRLCAPRDVRGGKQRGTRYAVIVQSRSAATRLGDLVGYVSLAELQAIDAALRLAVGLD